MYSIIDRHVHLEGGIDVQWLRNQAELKNVKVPTSLENLWKGYKSSFEDFIEAFFFSVSFLNSKESIREAFIAITNRTIDSGGVGFDLWCSPHWLVVEKKQITLEDFWEGIREGRTYAKARGIASCIVIDAINHLGIEHGHSVLDLIEVELPEFVVGFSTGGLERVAFREWAKVFERARKMGLHIAAHAGENGSATNVKEAVLEGGVERIIHGVLSDIPTFELLSEHKISVDVCPSSNKVLVPQIEKHPLPIMMNLGLRCALGTDDPGLIPCTLKKEYALVKEMGLSIEQIQKLKEFSMKDAWCYKI